MDEWLTTGQMIDLIKPGEIAESKDGYRVQMSGAGSIIRESSNELQLCGNVFVSMMWHILPKFVSFSEAMRGVEEGKNAACYFNDKKITIESRNNKISAICQGNACSAGGGASILIAWIVAGKWAIED